MDTNKPKVPVPGSQFDHRSPDAKITEDREELNMFLIPHNETATAEGKDQLQVRIQRSTDLIDQTAASQG